MVANCAYIAEGAIDDFEVCALHDHAATRGILEEGWRPAAYSVPSGHPIVMPCGPLEEKHLDPLSAPEWAVRAADDPRLDAVPEGPAPNVHPDFDLSR